ncbi:MAG: peptide-N4-asparagine amidase, partial [Rhodanobacter sp.]
MPIKEVFRRLRVTPWVILFASCALAAPVAATSVVGSTNVTTADPGVPRPPGSPCVVQLFSDVTFTDFNSRPYTYAPPASCRGNWSKVVLEADFSVTAGRQFDRTANLWLGGVNLYFGTTQEPSSLVSPSWHVERDLTDYSALLRQAGNGQAVIGNVVDGT